MMMAATNTTVSSLSKPSAFHDDGDDRMMIVRQNNDVGVGENEELTLSSGLEAQEQAPSVFKKIQISQANNSSKRSSTRPALGGSSLSDHNHNLALHKLRFRSSSSLLYGRNEEIETLEQALARAACSKSRELVLLAGEAGAGKSALAQHVPVLLQKQQQATKQNESTGGRGGGTSSGHGFCAYGKFDQRDTSKPYAAILAACSEVCDAICFEREEEELVTANFVPEDATMSPNISALTSSSVASSTTSNSQERTSTAATSARSRQRFFQYSFEEMANTLQKKLADDEVCLLTKLVPNLRAIVPGHGEPDNNSNNTLPKQRAASSSSPTLSSSQHENNRGETPSSLSTKGHLEGRNRLHYAFRRFFRAICQFSFAPLVLVIDDMQWSDRASTDLMEFLLTDVENDCSLVIIGCYRSDEVCDTHLLSKMVRNIQEGSSTNSNGENNKGENAQRGLPQQNVTKIEIGNLTVPQVNTMLVDLLSAEDPSATQSLAEIVHRKSLGNAFFVLHFLQTLSEQQHLLGYDTETKKWKWDIEQIQTSTTATENVVDLMRHKLDNLPVEVCRVLQHVSCLGSTFSYNVFCLVLQHYNDTNGEGRGRPGGDGKEADSLTADYVLAVSLQEGLLEEPIRESSKAGGDCQQKTYRWVHDKIQESFFLLIPYDQLATVQFQIGELLYGSDYLESNIFATAKLLNKGIDLVDNVLCRDGDPVSRRVELAQLQLRAGIQAIETSAFVTATKCLAAGIQFLPDGYWKQHYDLSLQLYSTAAEAEYCVGNFVKLNEYCNQVLVQHDRPLVDKRRAYNVLLDSLAAQERMEEAAELCLEILSQLECRFPSRGVGLFVIAGFLRINVVLRRWTRTRLLSLPNMACRKKIWVMDLLNKMVTFCYHIRGDVLLPLVVLKSVRWTLRYGLSELAPPTLATLGFALAGSLGDFKGGELCANHALALLDKVDSARIECRTLLLSQAFVAHWKVPLRSILKPLLRGYEAGLNVGDTENAMWCIFFYLESMVHAGMALEPIVADLQLYCNQMKSFRQMKQWSYSLILWQTILNLIGRSECTYELTGEVMNELDILERAEETGSASHLKGVLIRFQMYVRFIFGEYELVWNLMKETGWGFFEKNIPGIFGLYPINVLNALACISMARRTRKKKYEHMARKLTKVIKGWVEHGNPNVVHSESLLDAELAALKGREGTALRHYERAISLARQHGFIQDEALAHERCGEYAQSRGETNVASYHMNKAISLYEEWGAKAKAEQVRRKHSLFVSPPSEIVLGNSSKDITTATATTLSVSTGN